LLRYRCFWTLIKHNNKNFAIITFFSFQFAPLLLPTYQPSTDAVGLTHTHSGGASLPRGNLDVPVEKGKQSPLEGVEVEGQMQQEAAARMAAFERELAAFEARRRLADKEKRALDQQQQLIRDQAAALELQRLSLKIQQDTLADNQRALKQNQEAVARAQEQREKAIAASALRAAQNQARRVQEEEVLRHADQVLQLQAAAAAALQGHQEQGEVAPLIEAARAEREQQEHAAAAAAALMQEQQALEEAAAELLALDATPAVALPNVVATGQLDPAVNPLVEITEPLQVAIKKNKET